MSYALKSRKNTYLTTNGRGGVEAKALKIGPWEKWKEGRPPGNSKFIHIVSKAFEHWFLASANSKIRCEESPNPNDTRLHWLWEDGKYIRNAADLKYLAIDKKPGSFVVTLVNDPTPECIWEKEDC